MRPVLLVDGDDTLWYTQPMYTEALEDYFWLMEQLGFRRKMAEQYQLSINLDFVRDNGFQVNYFGQTFVDAYDKMARFLNRETHDLIRHTLKTLGDTVYTRIPQKMEYADDFLDIAGCYYDLILYTAGNEETQLRKARANGLLDYFKLAWVVGDKTPEVLGAYIDAFEVDRASVTVIGNSLKSDINPAIACSVRAIHFDNPTWTFDQTELADPNVPRVKSLMEAIAFLPELRRNSAKSA